MKTVKEFYVRVTYPKNPKSREWWVGNQSVKGALKDDMPFASIVVKRIDEWRKTQ